MSPESYPKGPIENRVCKQLRQLRREAGITLTLTRMLDQTVSLLSMGLDNVVSRNRNYASKLLTRKMAMPALSFNKRNNGQIELTNDKHNSFRLTNGNSHNHITTDIFLHRPLRLIAIEGAIVSEI